LLIQVSVDRSSRKIAGGVLGWAESNSDDHQAPSFHQSLLSGFSPVAAEPSPEVDGPTYPMSRGGVRCRGQRPRHRRDAEQHTEQCGEDEVGACST